MKLTHIGESNCKYTEANRVFSELPSSSDDFLMWCSQNRVQYCKTLNVSIPFIPRAKQNREFKGMNINCRPKQDEVTRVFRIVWF